MSCASNPPLGIDHAEGEPVWPGVCQHCGALPARKSGKLTRKLFCSPACRSAWRKEETRLGRRVARLAMIWRRHKGAKGTPAEGKLTEITALVEAHLREQRTRHAATKARRCS